MKRFAYSESTVAHLWAMLLAFVISCATALIYLGGFDLLNGRPIVFSGDASFHYMYAKVALQNVWSWQSDYLGAPLGFQLTAFGVNLTPETAIMKVLQLTTDDPVSLLNRTWIVCIGLTAVNGYVALRLLRLPWLVSVVCGVLFALVPYVFFRHVGHFNLNFTFIAIPTAAAILITSGEIDRIGPRVFWGVLSCCALPGLAYIYYPFFVAFLFLTGLTVAFLNGASRLALRRGSYCLIVLLGATALNLLPTLISWKVEGRPENLNYKNVAEADVYALNIRDLILPDKSTPIPGLKKIGEKSSSVSWPHMNENQSAKLGTVAACGFVLSLLFLLGIRAPLSQPHLAYAKAAAALNLALLLLSVTGGLGSLFNLFVSSDIRAYNRVAPIIAFLSLFIVGTFLSWIATRFTRFPIVGTGLSVAVLTFGLFEQNTAAHLRREAAENEKEASHIREFVHKVEMALPPGATIFMLPITTFPADMDRNRMQSSDHAKPTLFSSKLRWSWPHFGRANDRFVRAIGSPRDPAFLDNLRSFDFSHVWVDGYGPVEEMNAITGNLLAGGAKLMVSDSKDRYRVYELPGKGSSLPKRPILLDFGTGFFGPAVSNEGTEYRWARNRAQLLIQNPQDGSRHVRLKFSLQGFTSGKYVELTLGTNVQRFPLSNITTEYAFDFTIPGHSKLPLLLASDAGRHTTSDPRDLRFAFFAPRIVDLEK